MIPLIAITISTKYDDILNIILKPNLEHLTKWYIVTHETDQKTIDVIHNANSDKIEILYFDFWKNRAKFNKGGAVQYAQQIVYDTYRNQNICVLILDSDIYLPNDFTTLYTKLQEGNGVDALRPNVLYAPFHRIDFRKESDFVNKRNGQIYYLDQKHMGFFQLYYLSEEVDREKLYYENSVNCATCDSLFRNFFKERKLIKDLFVSHLGVPKVNWNTRKSQDDFIVER